MQRTLAVFTLLTIAGIVSADNWPAWRGPTGQGQCFEKNLPLKWSATENVKWKVALPEMGNSTPIVWKDKVFLTMAKKGGNLRSLVCLDRADGKKLWQKDIEYPEREQNWTPDWYANASPTTDGERVVVSFGSAGLYCFDFKGDLLWKRTDLGKWEHSFGNASAPVLYQDLCILWCGPNTKGKGGNYLLAMKKKTGETVWSVDEKLSSWGTPVIVQIDGKDELLYSPTHQLKSVDPKTGKENWHCEGLMEYVYTSPLYSSEHKIAVAMSGYQKSALAVKITGSAQYTKSDLLWHHPRNDQRVGSGVIVGDHVYIYEENGGAIPIPIGPKCYELKTGKEVWQLEKKFGGNNWGSMVHADGRLYVLTRDGTTYVFKASPKFEVLATNRLAAGETTNSSPAISDGEIFLRTNRHLWCIHVDPKAVPTEDWIGMTPPLEDMRKRLKAALGEHFELTRDQLARNERGDRYWLVHLKVKREGEFVFRCETLYDPPVPPHKDEKCETEFKFSTAKADAVRVLGFSSHSLSSQGATATPEACVGDTLILPIRIQVNNTLFRIQIKDTKHRFQLTAKPFDKFNDAWGQYRAIMTGKLEIQSDADKVVKLLMSGSGIGSGPESRSIHTLMGGFEAIQPAQCNLHFEIDPKADKLKQRTPGAEVALDILKKSAPIEVWLNGIKTDSGPKGKPRTFERVTPASYALRVGDRLIFHAGSYTLPQQQKDVQHPPVYMVQKKFAPQKEPFKAETN